MKIIFHDYIQYKFQNFIGLQIETIINFQKWRIFIYKVQHARWSLPVVNERIETTKGGIRAYLQELMRQDLEPQSLLHPKINAMQAP